MTTIYYGQMRFPEVTLTAADLIAELQQLEADTPILITYEGVTGGLSSPMVPTLGVGMYKDVNDAPITVAIINVELY